MQRSRYRYAGNCKKKKECGVKNVKTGADVASLVGATLPVKYKNHFRRIDTSRQKNVLVSKLVYSNSVVPQH